MSSRKRDWPRRFWTEWRILAALAVLIVLAVAEQGRSERWQTDLWTALLAPAASTHPRIAIVAINDQTLSRFRERSPIDRAFLARLITGVASAQPLAIGIDVLFDQASDPEKDEELRQALHAVQVPVVVAWAESSSAQGQIRPDQERYLGRFLEAVDNPRVMPALANLRADTDGTIRKLALRAPGAPPNMTMPLALAQQAHATLPDGLDMPLAYFGHPSIDRATARQKEPFVVFPAELIDPTLVAWQMQSRLLRGRVVLIGADLAGIDQHRTPFAADILTGPSTTPGVFILAQSVAQLLDGRTLARVPPWITTLLALVTIGAGALFGRGEWSAWKRATATTGCIVILLAVSVALYLLGGTAGSLPEAGPVLPLATPVLGLLGGLTIGVADARRRNAGEKTFIRSVLTRYVPPAMVSRMLAHPTDLKLGGERREISLVYTDIAGFTTLCENAKPSELVPALNRYLDGMTRIIHAHGGTVAGFIGDAILAFWGAPLDDPEQSVHALRAAIEMNRFAKASRQAFQESGLDFGRTRIGVHRGMVTVGNFGGPLRLEYMAHGDPVNTVARLEGANKYLGTDIAVSGAVIGGVGGAIPTRPVGELVLKGKARTIAVFEPIEEASGQRYDAYMAAYDLLLTGSRAAALAAFEALQRAFPEDHLAKLHLDRLTDEDKQKHGVLIVLDSK